MSGISPRADAPSTISATAAWASAGVPFVIQSPEGMLPSSCASARAWPESDCAASRVVLYGLR